MHYKLIKHLKPRSVNYSLPEMDNLYKTAISDLAADTRIAYCQSLIYRTQLDLEMVKEKVKRHELEQFLKAAQNEIHRLGSRLDS
jgi:uncharacterized alpha-E superfamily protein